MISDECILFIINDLEILSKCISLFSYEINIAIIFQMLPPVLDGNYAKANVK